MILKCMLIVAALVAPVQASTPIILISVDTLRADHLGIGATPNIDSLARGGTLFSQVNTPYPLTLPAHTALLTSTYPFANGVQDNGIPLNAGAVSLAMVLKQAGYHTAAFVGSFVLDQRFGLNAGFDVYDGPLDVHNKVTAAPLERKRAGDEVTSAARQWLDKNSGSPFFLFLHLYDLHEPYSLPANPAQRHGGTGYQAELAFVDRVLGDFFTYLQRRGLFEKSLIVFTSDHGEGLGDHAESTHGYFVYQSTLHVPLIVHWPAGAKRAAQGRVDEPGSLLDVAPTVLEWLGIQRPAEMRGQSLLQHHAEEIYSESLYARKHFGCAALRSLRSANYKYIEAPKPELYDLSSDPGEQHNLYDQQRAKATAMRERLVAIRGNAADNAGKVTSPETVSALRSLGYLSGPASRTDAHTDPKDRIADFERYLRALGERSDEGLKALSNKLPDVPEVRMSLGIHRQREGRFEEAARDFARVVQLAPSTAAAHFELGLCQFKMQQHDEAIKEFKTTLLLEPWYTRADEALAEIYLHNQDFAEARNHLKHLLAVDPNSYTAHFNLGIFAAMDKDWSLAKEHMQAALRADPNSAEAHKTLGGIYMQMGDEQQARRELDVATRLQSVR